MNVDHIRVTEILTLDKEGQFGIKTTGDGYLTAMPRVGRIGIQLYNGRELGRPEMDVVRVWRPEAEVMHKDSATTVTHRPVTNDHPTVAVDANNWKKYAVGQTGDEVMRDGEYIRVPMCLMDAGVIKDYNDGKKELSLGYTSNIEWRSGTTDKGEQFDAVQTNIRINHLAVVDAARGGSKLAIGDSVSLDQAVVDRAKKLIADGKVAKSEVLEGAGSLSLSLDNRYPFLKDGKVYRSALESIKAEAGTNQHSSIVVAADELLQLIDTMRKKQMSGEEKLVSVMVDGIGVTMGDVAASVVTRRLRGLETEAGDLATKLEKAEKKAKDAEDKAAADAGSAKKKLDEDAATIATLQQQLKDAAITPSKLDEMVRDRHLVVGKAKAVIGDKLVIDGKTEAEIRRQVVDAKLGDTAKGWSDDAVSAGFATLTSDVKVDTAVNAADRMRQDFSRPNLTNDARETVYDNYDKRLSSAYKGEQPKQ